MKFESGAKLMSGGALALAVLLAAALPAAAQSPESEAEADARDQPSPDVTPAPAPDVGSLTYGTVDQTTVRVFAIGTVAVETFEVAGQRVTVANTTGGHGTGFVAGPSGLILTAHHVVDGARHVVVRLPGAGGFFAARVVYWEREADIALLKIEADPAPLEMPRDASLKVRQTIFAIGYPMDAARTQPQSARGIVAGQLDNGTLQLDIAVNPGNSGGPLLDDQDRVVGMVVARGAVERGVQGIGFAVPAARLAAAIAEAKQRVRASGVAPLADRDRQSATVVDQLIQRGALHQLREAGDLRGGLTSGSLESALGSLTARVQDADLLVYIAGNLWNGALVIEFGGVRTIGKTTLTDDEASALVSRLRTASLDACRRAVELDDSVSGRSPFVELALRHSAPEPPGPPVVVGRSKRRTESGAWNRGMLYGGLGFALLATTDQCQNCRESSAPLGVELHLGARVAPRWGLDIAILGTGHDEGGQTEIQTRLSAITAGARFWASQRWWVRGAIGGITEIETVTVGSEVLFDRDLAHFAAQAGTGFELLSRLNWSLDAGVSSFTNFTDVHAISALLSFNLHMSDTLMGF